MSFVNWFLSFVKGHRALKFCIVGGATFALYNVLMYLLVEYGAVAVAAATIPSYLLAVLFNYLAHYLWTFGTHSPHLSVLIRYVVMVASGFFFNFIGVSILVSEGAAHYLIIQNLVLVGVTVWNFVLSHTWVFK